MGNSDAQLTDFIWDESSPQVVTPRPSPALPPRPSVASAVIWTLFWSLFIAATLALTPRGGPWFLLGMRASWFVGLLLGALLLFGLSNSARLRHLLGADRKSSVAGLIGVFAGMLLTRFAVALGPSGGAFAMGLVLVLFLWLLSGSWLRLASARAASNKRIERTP